ncbi:MAG: cytochrome ubiquinol oxidase subunit I [Bdellovibrionota bacterium]
MDALTLHRLHFAFTITFHYLFPQLTMGLSLLLVVLKTLALRTKNAQFNDAARFWAKIFAINFAIGVVTGIPMEFQFGTNWSRFSELSGGVIGQPLAMEGVFSFFLESTFLGVFLYAEKKLSPIQHWGACFLVFLGSWISGFFIIATDAWMQHPVGYTVSPTGQFQLESLSALLTNPWLPWQYLHNMIAAVVTGSFVMAAVGAYYCLTEKHLAQARIFVKTGVIAGSIASFLLIFPTGDRQGANVAKHQPVTLAAMEGLFHTQKGAELALIGQPDPEKLRLDNPITIPGALSFLTYQRWEAEVKGLEDFPKETWPDNIPLLYYSYHIMVGLGTIFLAIQALALLHLLMGTLFERKTVLWLLMLSFPFPYIATTAGWITAEVGRQPWLIYGLLRTAHGSSPHVTAGNTLFTLIGFMGLYTVLAMLFLLLIYRVIHRGPTAKGA